MNRLLPESSSGITTNRQKTIDRFLETTKGSWIPQWGAEVTVASHDLGDYLHQTYERARSNPVGRTKKILRQVTGYHAEALSDQIALTEGIDLESIYSPINEEQLVESDICLSALAKYKMFTQAFLSDVWPNHRPQADFSKKLTPYKHEVASMPKEDRSKLFIQALGSATCRSQFWLNQREHALNDKHLRNVLS